MALREQAALWRKRKSSGTPAPGCYIPFYVQARAASFLPPPFEPFYLDLSPDAPRGPPAPPPFARGDSPPPVPSALQKRRRRRYCPRWLCGRMSGAAGSGRGLSSLWRQACRWIPSIFSALRGKRSLYRTLGFTGHSHFAELDVQERNNPMKEKRFEVVFSREPWMSFGSWWTR